MAIPDTNTFSLQDVVNEVNPTTDDLVDCFADAIAGNFDPEYEGNKDSLLNFRNYGGIGTLAPTYAGASTMLTTSNTNLLTVLYPADVVSGDFLVMIVMKGLLSATESYDTPSGWTKVGNTEGDIDLSCAVYTKTAGSSEPSTVTVNALNQVESSAGFSGVMYKYKGVSSSSLLYTLPVAYVATREDSLSDSIPSNQRYCYFHCFTGNIGNTNTGTYIWDNDQGLLGSGIGSRLTAMSESNGSYKWGWTSQGSTRYNAAVRIVLTK